MREKAGLLQSSEQGIDLQASLAAAWDATLSNTNHAKIYVLGGFGWQRTQYAPSVFVSVEPAEGAYRVGGGRE